MDNTRLIHSSISESPNWKGRGRFSNVTVNFTKEEEAQRGKGLVRGDTATLGRLTFELWFCPLHSFAWLQCSTVWVPMVGLTNCLLRYMSAAYSLPQRAPSDIYLCAFVQVHL